MIEIKVEGLKEIIEKMSKFPDILHREATKTMEATLRTLQANIPAYPPQRPTTNYARTGTLGRSVGLGGGKPDIFKVAGTGGDVIGEFGSNLYYAQYVIGERQPWWTKHWWQLKRDVPTRAMPQINKLWEDLVRDLADFLNRN